MDGICVIWKLRCHGASQSLSPEGRDGATGIRSGYQYGYGARNGSHMAVKGRSY